MYQVYKKIRYPEKVICKTSEHYMKIQDVTSEDIRYMLVHGDDYLLTYELAVVLRTIIDLNTNIGVTLTASQYIERLNDLEICIE